MKENTIAVLTQKSTVNRAVEIQKSTLYRAAVIATLEMEEHEDWENFLSLCRALMKADEEEFQTALKYARSIRLKVMETKTIAMYSPSDIDRLQSDLKKEETVNG